MNPPLRCASDRDALIEGLIDGTIDALATDHAPHSSVEKDVEFDCAAAGMLGFETALPLMLELVRKKYLTPLMAIEKMTIGPSRAFGLSHGVIAQGSVADLTLVDPEHLWKLDPKTQFSKSKNSPFMGQMLQGKAQMTLVAGQVKYERNNE